MLKKIGFVTAGTAAGLMMMSGLASAQGSDDGARSWGGDDDFNQVGLVNLSNVDVLHNVNASVGVCGNDVNVLGVQVPIRDTLNGIGVPILSPGAHEAESQSPYNCSAANLEDGGSIQDN